MFETILALTTIAGMPIDNLSTIISAYVDANNPLEESEINALSSYVPPFMWKKLQNVLLPARPMYENKPSQDTLDEKIFIFHIIRTWCQLNPNASMTTFLRTIENSSLSKDDQNRIFVSVLNCAVCM